MALPMAPMESCWSLFGGFGGSNGFDGVDGIVDGLVASMASNGGVEWWRRMVASMASMGGIGDGDWGLRHRGH